MATRAERRQRQAQDDGAPDETVYALPQNHRTVTNGRDARLSCPTVYHDDAACSGLGTANTVPKEMARTEAMERHLAPCERCIVGYDQPAEKETTCPFCGEEIRELPERLPDGCEGVSR